MPPSSYTVLHPVTHPLEGDTHYRDSPDAGRHARQIFDGVAVATSRKSNTAGENLDKFNINSIYHHTTIYEKHKREK